MASTEIQPLQVKHDMCRLQLLTCSLLLIIVASLLLFTNTQATELAKANSIAVVYPIVREPYRRVFESIITGIEQYLGSDVQRFASNGSENAQSVNNWLRQHKINSVIALGRRSHMLTRTVTATATVITGAVLMSPELKEHTGIALNPNPNIVFAKLQELAPNVKQIIVIYNPNHNAWLITRAKQAALEQHIKLKAYSVTDLHQAAKLYRDVLKRQSGTENAIWLLNDKSVFDSNAIFPLILQESWDRKFLVFSNNPAHVKRGVLFAMYPNNIQMGKSLAKLVLANKKNEGKSNNTMLLLNDLLIAFNLRTADHVGLKVTRKQRDEFNLLFPAR